MRKKGSGWHGESRKHSLARKGVRIARGNLLQSYRDNKNKERMISEGTFNVYSTTSNLEDCIKNYEANGFSVWYEKVGDNLYRVWGYKLDIIDLDTLNEWQKDMKLQLVQDKYKYGW